MTFNQASNEIVAVDYRYGKIVWNPAFGDSTFIYWRPSRGLSWKDGTAVDPDDVPHNNLYEVLSGVILPPPCENENGELC